MDPDFSYRTTPNLAPVTRQAYSKDDADNSTLKAVYKDLTEQRAALNKWDAFNISKDDPLTIKQQIEVNRKVYEILQPSIDAIESALALTDAKFKDRG